MNEKNEKNDLRWSLYVLPNGREVYLTQRPDVANKKSVLLFEKEKKPLIRFNFCDDFVSPTKTVSQWFPWLSSRSIPIENLFAFISMMSYFDNKKSDRPIWLHCDSSSMRAPTYFGLFLRAVYPKEEKDICKKMSVNEGNDLNYALYSRADRYADISCEQDSHVEDLILAWNNGGERLAHQNMMKIRRIKLD